MQFSKLSVLTVLAMASSAQAQSKYAGYIARTNADSYWAKDLEQKAFEDIMSSESCPDVADAKIEWESASANPNGSVAAYLKSIPTQTSPKSKEWDEYIKYYGNDQFHIQWVDAAFKCSTIAGTPWLATNFAPDFGQAYCGGTSDLGGGGAPTYPLLANPVEVVTGKECVGVEESAKKATSYVYQFLEVVQLMEKAIFDARNGDCQAQRDILEGLQTPSLPVCQDAMEYWDAAAAIYTGSLEGPDGAVLDSSNERAYGKTFYTLADKRCRNFMTCGPNVGGAGDPVSPDRFVAAGINAKIVQFFQAGGAAAYAGDYSRMEFFKRKISAKMMVPWVQGTMRYTHRMSESRSTDATQTHKELGEASTFALGALPKLWACSVAAAEKMEPLVRTGNDRGVGNEIDFEVVKFAFECNYRCLGITCEEVGSLWDSTDSIKPDAEACKDKDNLSGVEEVAKCLKPNSKFNKKCKNYLGKSGVSKRSNLDYFVRGL